MSLVVSGGTILDGIADRPLEGRSVFVEGGRITAIRPDAEFGVQQSATVIDARGRYVIPGFMNANVHLLGDFRPENLVRHEGRYELLITEAAQVALRNGLTTVFDTWGPRLPLMAVRDRIAAGEVLGSRIFCAGNIVGLEGPFSRDFIARAPGVFSPALTSRLNALWAENVGPDLMWMTPDDAAREVRGYIANGIDFVKFASTQHPISTGALLALSPKAQCAIVEEAHRAGLTAQAHTHTVEGPRISVEAGCDLIQHAT
jgi:imidazolonepropionase-like amidohydrolase